MPDAPLQSNVDGTVAKCAVAISIRDVAIDVVGTHPRDVVVHLQGAPSGREAKRGVRCRGGILASQTVCYAQGCLRADVPPGQKDTGLVTRCAVARICNVAVDIVGPHIQDVVVPRRVALVDQKAKGSVRKRGGTGIVCQEASRVRRRCQIIPSAEGPR